VGRCIRARALYERLGYVAYGSARESWDEDGPDGTVVRYETVCTLMRKELGWFTGTPGGGRWRIRGPRGA
jgi:hypothetical protein